MRALFVGRSGGTRPPCNYTERIPSRAVRDYPGVVKEPQTWALLALLAATVFGMFKEMRGDRAELRSGLESIRNEIAGLRGELSEIKVLVGRMDERLKGLEAR